MISVYFRAAYLSRQDPVQVLSDFEYLPATNANESFAAGYTYSNGTY